MAEEPFKTNDMGMVTFLKLEGHTPQRIDFEGPDCWWFFMMIPALEEDINAFLTGEAWVQPQAYNKKFAETKREMGDARARRDQEQRSKRQSGR